jgi:hypothetical protein
LGLDKPPDPKVECGSDINMLLHLHTYLNKQANKSHISVSRSRYLKYCYYETYQGAVKALRDMKRRGREEKRKVSKHKMTATYKHELSDSLPSTPTTDEINASYSLLTMAERGKRAEDVVKIAIIRGMIKSPEDDINAKITSYLKEGRTMHFIL